MAPPRPTDFNMRGAAAVMERKFQEEKKAQQDLLAIREKVLDQLGEEERVRKRLNNSEAQAIKYMEDYRDMFSSVSGALAKHNMSAKAYAKQVEKDTKAVALFAEAHKLTLQEASNLYTKLKDKEQDFWDEKKKRMGQFVSGILTVKGATDLWQRRVEEINAGSKLFMASTDVVGKGFSGLRGYMEVYRKATRETIELAQQYGVSQDDVQASTTAVALALRGVTTDTQLFGKMLQQDTKGLYEFSRMMNVETGDALQFFRDQMRMHGLTHKEAVHSMDLTIASYSRLATEVKGTALPLKEEYLETLKSIQQEMGPIRVSTTAVTATMNLLAAGAAKAGLSGQAVSNAMKSMTKLMSGLPDFYKYKIGKQFLGKWRTDFETFGKNLPGPLQKAFKTIDGMKIPDFMKSQFAYEQMMGTEEGIKAVVKQLGAISETRRVGMLQQMGLSNQDILSTVDLFKQSKDGKIGSEKIADMIKKTGKEQKKATDARRNQYTMQVSQLASTDKLVKWTQNLTARMKESVLKNDALMGAMLTLNTTMNIKSMTDSVAGGMGKWGKTVGIMGNAGGVIGAAAVGLQVGIAVGNALMDAEDRKQEKEKARAGKAIKGKLAELKAAQAARMKGLSKKEQAIELVAHQRKLYDLQNELGATAEEFDKLVPGMTEYRKSLAEQFKVLRKEVGKVKISPEEIKNRGAGMEIGRGTKMLVQDMPWWMPLRPSPEGWGAGPATGAKVTGAPEASGKKTTKTSFDPTQNKLTATVELVASDPAVEQFHAVQAEQYKRKQPKR